MVSNEYVLLLYVIDFIPRHAYYYYKPTTPTIKGTLPTTTIVQKKSNPNSPSAITKLKKMKKMKKNLDDLLNHVTKQATGRAPSMPNTGGVCQPSPPDCFEEVDI